MESNYNESVINSKILANHYLELLDDFLPPYSANNKSTNLRRFESNNKILDFLKQIQRLIKEEKCDKETFKTDTIKIKKLNLLHLECLWYLEVAELISLQDVLNYHKDNPEIIDHFSEKLLEHLLEEKPSIVRKEMLLAWLKALCEDMNGSCCQALLKLMTDNLKDEYDSKKISISNLVMLLKEAGIESEVVCCIILNHLLEGAPVLMTNIFKKQEKIKTDLKNSKTFILLKDIINHVECSSIIELVKKQLVEKFENNNWDYMLVLITSIGVHYQNGWETIKNLCVSLIKESFNSSDSKQLASAFLLARQGCFEKGNTTFPNYIQWFSSNFSSESRRPLNSKQTCHLFFEFLKDLIPYDSPYYLKVHINRSPWVPLDCQFMLTEYVAIVKTQLLDLNMSTELGICDNTTDKSAAVFDVENVLDYFSRTNEILNSVFQASMFCKEYYEKKFLVELLSKFEGKKSVRHKFITKLHSMGKVPNVLFKNYKSLEKKK